MRRLFYIIPLILAALLAIPGAARADTYDQLAMDENTGWVLTSATSALDGNQVFIYQSFDNVNQEFAEVPESPGTFLLKFHILNTNTNQEMCIQDDNTEGTQLFLEPCAAIGNQLWRTVTFNDGHTGFQSIGAGTFNMALNNNDLTDFEAIINWHFVQNAAYEEMHFLGT